MVAVAVAKEATTNKVTEDVAVVVVVVVVVVATMIKIRVISDSHWNNQGLQWGNLHLELRK